MKLLLNQSLFFFIRFYWFIFRKTGQKNLEEGKTEEGTQDVFGRQGDHLHLYPWKGISREVQAT